VLVLSAIAVSLVGYVIVWFRIRPGRLRLAPRFPSPAAFAPPDVSAPATVPIPVTKTVRAPRIRPAILLVNSAIVVFGLQGAFSAVVGLAIRGRTTVVPPSDSVARGLAFAVVNSLATSVLEECGTAVAVLAVAGVAARYFPRHWDLRSIALTAVVVGAVARTCLHIPLWGAGAIGRIGLSVFLAWLYWRTRRIWPLLVGHLLWDTVAIQTLVSPSLQVRGLCAVLILAWVITGTVIAGIALSRSRRSAVLGARYLH
jgi:membrane protease YdiL (CAAX protease family)